MVLRRFASGSSGEEKYISLNDEVLWEHLKAGDKNALAFIYKTYFTRLYSYGIKLFPDSDVVKDCIHDLFVALWRSRRNLSATSSIKFYLYASLKRRIITQPGRYGRLSPGRFFSTAENRFDLVASPEEDLIRNQAEQEKKEKLLRMINKLSKRQKEILYLRYYEGLSTREAAAIMSLNIRSAYVLLSKALDVLKKNRDKLIFLLLSFF